MKNLILTLLFASIQIQVYAQNLQQATYYRLYGTNLYSFAPLAASPARANYTVSGKVMRKENGSVYVEQDLGNFLIFNGDKDFLYASPSEQLKMLFVKQRIEQTGGQISMGEFMSWDESARSYATFVHKTREMLLKNCPERVQVGETISCFALPIASTTAEPIIFDYGKPFVGNLDEHSDYFEIRPASIVKIHRESKKIVNDSVTK